MGADLSRIRSNPLLDFAGVELKQGGVVLDADVNELVAAVDRRLRALASDVLGAASVSQTTPAAFKLSLVAGALLIAKGRLYVDGLLAENHGAASDLAAKQLFDPLLAEPVFADAIAYTAQPYLPNPPALPEAGRHLVYLDVWQREVTHIERPALVEIAVGVETSSRLQTVWQVRVLNEDAGNASCASEDADFSGWAGLIAPSTGRLTNGTFVPPASADPCELPPSGDYLGLENQTYRVEIHDAGPPGGSASFKWSRENASVASRVAAMVSGTELQLQTLGRDDVLRFSTGDWVEIVDDEREFSQAPGEMRRISVNEAAKRISFSPALPAAMLPPSFPDSTFPDQRNLRVRRWDQKGKVLQAVAGTPLFQDLDLAPSRGVISVPAAGTALLLENGVTVSFAATGAGGAGGAKGFRAGDFWVFAARTADASVEPLRNAPPRGVHHHYARLGVWTVGAGDPSDCRHPWPPRGDGHDCSCTECVTAESHANGSLTIQAAVDRVRDTGGTVCLGAGRYVLRQPVLLAGARSVRLRGQGTATVVVAPGGAFVVRNGIALAIEDLLILAVGSAAAISVHTALGLSLQRLVIAVLAGSDNALGVAIALTGAVLAASIRDNTVLAPVGIAVTAVAPAIPGTNQPPPPLLLSALLRIEDNLFLCDRLGIALAGRVFHVGSTRITGNELAGCRQGGIVVLGLGAAGSSMRIAGNSASVSGPAIIAGVNGLWIEGNQLTAEAQRANRIPDGAGITLRSGLDPNGADQCQLLANQIAGFSGAAIAVQSPVRDLIVKLNLIERCGNGIVCVEEADTGALSIENNHLRDIGHGGEAQQGFVVGVGVLRAGSATVAGNRIQRVGQQATLAALKAGVAGFSVGRWRASGNQISAVAPPLEFNGLAAGVLLFAPFAQADIAHNQVDRDELASGQGTKTGWNALRVDQPGENRLVIRVGTYAAVRVDAARTLVFGMKRPFLVVAPVTTDVAGAVAPSAVGLSVLGNAFGARGAEPAVDISIAGDCLFNDNRCELRGNTGPVAVSLATRTAIVNANRVVGGEASVLLQTDPKLVTVLGNITTGAIVAGGLAPASWSALGAPWAALNVRA